MKRKRIIAFLMTLSLLLGIVPVSLAEEETNNYYYLEETKQVYKEKDEKSEEVYPLEKYSVAIGKESDGWLEVNRGSGYLKLDDNCIKMEKTKIKLIKDTDFIIGSSNSNLSLGQVEKGYETIAYSHEDMDWYFLTNYTIEDVAFYGFIAKDATEKIKEEKPEEKPSDFLTIKGYISAQDKLNVRDNPNNGEILGKLDRNTYIEGKLHGSWVEIEYDGKTGYIHRAYVSDEKLDDTIKGYVSAKNKLNVRDNPGKGEILGKLERNTYVEGKLRGFWIEIEYEGKTGYIHRAYVSDEKLDDSSDDIIEGYINAKNKLNVRDNPNNGEIIGSLVRGTKISGTKEGNWIKINFENKVGYIHSSFVVEEKPADEIKGFITASVNKRKAASSSSVSLGYLARGTYIKASPVGNGTWLKVNLNGETFYIVKNFVSETPIKAHLFTKNNINVRKGPGLKYETYGRLAKGSYLNGEYVEDGSWVKFSNYGNTVYVNSNLVETVEAKKTGWIQKGSNNYYAYKGVPARGWKTIGSNKYYFDPMMRNLYTGLKNTGEGVYYFNKNGSLRTGYITVPGTTYNHSYNLAGPSKSELQNKWLKENERQFLGQKALNIALDGSGTKYTWYGIDLKRGVYCSGVPYAAYKQVGITIPGPEYGNLTDAKKHGQQSGDPQYGYGSAGEYGYLMASSQYTKGHQQVGSRIYFNGDFSKLKAGDIIFAKNPSLSNNIKASHSMIYAGMNNNRPMIIHSGFVQGNILDNISMVTSGWGYRLMPNAHRPYN